MSDTPALRGSSMTETRTRDAILAAVAEANRETDRPSIEEACRAELAHLWSDLGNARDYSADGVWSMQCDWIVARILILSRLVDPTPWEQIPSSLLVDRVYQQVYDAAGISYAAPDMDEIAALVNQ